MILSDPSESNLKTAQESLRPGDYPGAKLSFHQKRGEDSFLEPGSLDMVFACECLHYTDIEKAMGSIHASLRPGGTVASVFYGMVTARILDNERADAAWKAFVKMHFQRIRDERIRTVVGRAKFPHVWLGLNFVPFDKDLWHDVRRIFVNVHDGQAEWPTVGRLPEGRGLEGKSRVDPGYENLEWRCDLDGWAIKDCTTGRIRYMLESLLLQYGDKDWHSEEWKELEAAAQEGGGKVHLALPVAVILARKK